MADRPMQWQCPPAAVPEDRILGWVNEATEEGQSWLKAQRGYSDFRKAMDVLSGKPDSPEQLQYRSKLTVNHLKRNVREVVGALANIRPMWGYSSDNKGFADQAEMMNKTTRAIYLSRFFDRSFKEALQYSAATCTGWVRPVYRRAMYGTGKGNFELLTYGSPCVLPVQLPSNNDWQSAYTVTLLDEMPIAMAHGMFPLYQDRLRPTSNMYWYSSEIRQASRGNMFKRIFSSWRSGNTEKLLSDLYIPIRYTYVIDLTINRTGQMIPMGQHGTSWYYEVPSVGMPIHSGYDRDGNKVFRPATENDARLYPYRRLIITSQDCKMYDGPAFDWHGQLPLIPFTVDDWAWEAIGYSMVRDGFDIENAINELVRGVMDKHRAQLDMPLGYDMNSVSSNEAKAFDPMQPRARIGFDGSMVDKPFTEVVPADVLKVDPQTMAFVEFLSNTEDYQLGTNQVIALAKARAMAGKMDESAIEKLAEGPIVMDISRSMERSLTGVGDQFKYLILQYATARRIMNYVGEDGITPETFDFDPDSIVPSHIGGEDPFQADGKSPRTSMYSKDKRARWFADNLSFFILPHTAHEITQMSHKLALLQMRKAGLPVSWGAIAEAFSLRNPGGPNGNSMYEQFWAEKEDEVSHMIRTAEIAKSLGVTPPGAGGGPPKNEGRPSTDAAPPRIEQKDGGTRSTITTSRK